MKHQAINWAAFETLDSMRRLQGTALDTLGLVPVEHPYRTVFASSTVSLRRYGTGRERGPAVLIVPAPIKRPYVWDLAPEISVVGRCLAADAQVFLMEWRAIDADVGLSEFADRAILDCLNAIEHTQAILLGHSLGGLFAAIFSALHPERVKGLALITAPLHFAADVGVFGPIVADVDLGDIPDSVPGSFLSVMSFRSAPVTFGWERGMDWLCSLGDPVALRSHLQVERWTLDESPLPRRLFAEVVNQLVRENRFARGELVIGGRRAAPSQVTAPLLCVVDPRCRIVPLSSVLPFYEAVASHEKALLHYHGDVGVSLQHLGVLVGKSAHAFLWPEILSWIQIHGADRKGKALARIVPLARDKTAE